MRRRELVKVAAAAVAAIALAAHTPYGQWTIYRRRNLFIVASGTDAQAVALARALAEGLARELPESHAKMTRGTDLVRIASLLATEQLEVAVVSRNEAALMLAGSGLYRVVGPVQLRAITSLGDHILVTGEKFPARHAFLVAAAIEHLRPELPIDSGNDLAHPLPVPRHPGAALFYDDNPLPPD